jgi:hypothetical protein
LAAGHRFCLLRLVGVLAALERKDCAKFSCEELRLLPCGEVASAVSAVGVGEVGVDFSARVRGAWKTAARCR